MKVSTSVPDLGSDELAGDPAATAEVRVEYDPPDLHTGECSSCCGTRVVVDAETGAARPCARCAAARDHASSSRRSGHPGDTLRLLSMPSSQLGAVVAAELEAALASPGTTPSPLVSLARLVVDYFEARHDLRRAEAGLPSPVGDSYEEVLERAARAEAVLMRVVSTDGSEPDGDADLAEVAETVRRPAPAALGSPGGTSGWYRRARSWARGAWARLSGGWEPAVDRRSLPRRAGR